MEWMVVVWCDGGSGGCRGGSGRRVGAARDGYGGGDDGVEMEMMASLPEGEGKRRVAASGGGDRVDPVVGIVFDFGRKSPSEKFSGGGGVVVAGIRRRWPDMGREEEGDVYVFI
ncbi:hypothetical protein Tco_1453353 [Tanacetum coccineum]